MAAYFIFSHQVTNSEKLNNEYLPKAVETLAAYNPEILVVDQDIEIIEGTTNHSRRVVLKFKNRDEAKQWYNSAEYQAIIHLRLESVDGEAVLCDAFDPSMV